MWLTVVSGLFGGLLLDFLLFLNRLRLDDFIRWLGSFFSFGWLLGFGFGLFLDLWLVDLGVFGLLGFIGLLFRSFLLFRLVTAGRFLCLRDKTLIKNFK